MTTHVPQPDELPVPATSAREEPQAAAPSPSSASPSVFLPAEPEEEEDSQCQSYYFEDEQPDFGAAFAAPFQLSHAMPTVAPQGTQAQPPDQAAGPSASAVPPTPTNRKRGFSLPMIALLVCVVVIAGLLVMNALAQTTPPLQPRLAGSSQAPQPAGTSGKRQKPAGKPTPASSRAPTDGTSGQKQPSLDWVPQQLPNGWTHVGLSTGDAIEAERSAVAFTDREMSLDYRSVGSRNMHGGTFTAATFILTPAARQRFVRNDLREVNNTLFDMVTNTKLIRLVVDPQPQVVKFAEQGGQQFT